MSRREQANGPLSVLTIAADIGGSHTRVVVSDRTGAVRGVGRAEGANPVARPESAHIQFRTALASALGELDVTTVGSGVIGMAGSMALRDSAVRQRFVDAWVSCGLAATPRFVSDLEVAFASGSDDAAGSVLIAGTGVSAGWIADRKLDRRIGGHGWLLGDEGAGFWLGREAVRATLATLDNRRPPGALAQSVLSWFAVDDRAPADAVAAVVTEVNRRGGSTLAELAPLVSQASMSGDEQAESIVAEATQLLLGIASRLLRERPGTLVLAGSILADDSPIGKAVRKELGQRDASSIRAAGNGLLGAAMLALRDLPDDGVEDGVRERFEREINGI